MNIPQQEEVAYIAARIKTLGEKIDLQTWNLDCAKTVLESKLAKLAALQDEQSELIAKLKDILK